MAAIENTKKDAQRVQLDGSRVTTETEETEDDYHYHLAADQEMVFRAMDTSFKSQITAYELYRFIEWVASALFAALLTAWLFLPDEVIE